MVKLHFGEGLLCLVFMCMAFQGRLKVILFLWTPCVEDIVNSFCDGYCQVYEVLLPIFQSILLGLMKPPYSENTVFLL